MQGMLLGRRLLRLRGDGLVIDADGLGNLSAIAWTETTAGPCLWLAGDEAIKVGATAAEAAAAPARNAIIILRADASGGFVVADVVPLGPLLPGLALVGNGAGDEGEVDIEGLDQHAGWLWLTGSHSAKRRRPKKGGGGRLAQVETDGNRFLIARIPVADDRLLAVATDPQHPKRPRRAAALPFGGDGGRPGNALTEALADDPHLGPFLKPVATGAEGAAAILPGKDNGFDIEGLAVAHGLVYLGMRGPVLRGYALILVIRPEDDGAGQLRLKPVGDDGRLVRKLFVHLGGMGVRDLEFDGDDLLILAGPTMDLDGTQAVWRLHRPEQLAADSVTEAAADGASGKDGGRLLRLFDLPTGTGDRAEGLCRFDVAQEAAVMVVYDQTAAARHPPDEDGRPIPHLVYADLYRLPAVGG